MSYKYYTQILIFFLLSFVFLSCGSSSKDNNEEDTNSAKIQLVGSFKSVQKGKVILLKYANPTQANQTPYEKVDSVNTENGKFDFKVALEETDFFMLDLFGEKAIPLVLNPKDKEVKIEIDATQGELAYSIKGSRDSEYYKKINDIAVEYKQKTAELVDDNKELDNLEDKDEVHQAYLKIQKNVVVKMKKLIDEAMPSIVVVNALKFLDPEEEFDYIKKINSKLYKALPQSKYVQVLNQNITAMAQEQEATKHLTVGKIAPDIDLPDPNGNSIKLSSLRGKVVLIDFWASWCKPCRMENPRVVELYNQYKSQGFEIYGVSLDREMNNWLKAIEQDKLSWLHVSDLKFWQSDAAKTYHIRSIPATYLLDKSGKIIAKNLRGEELAQKVEEVLGKG